MGPLKIEVQFHLCFQSFKIGPYRFATRAISETAITHTNFCNQSAIFSNRRLIFVITVQISVITVQTSAITLNQPR